MIVSRRWLEALLDRPLDARDTAERLTMHVAPVDAVVPLHQDLGDIVVARVLEVKQHPNADRLTLCLVDAGGAGGKCVDAAAVRRGSGICIGRVESIGRATNGAEGLFRSG